ncbi:ABC transporter permease [Jannaschia sp. W003]|uniref:ABC transporter permease n=1 Tax=Jannaschia sp. W003 TaxID=2867012 RepID=UPI0021A8ABFC|nr:ABC transporter permease [Jannaschia sp. W003]UWQ21861.1 ABC transporter permease [Jannaschia sp. W003]
MTATTTDAAPLRARPPRGAAPRPPQKPRAFRRRFGTPRTVIALMLREMSSTYGRSPGGFLWVLLEPIAGIALLTAVFSMALRTPALGSNFPLFYATGVLPYLSFLGLAGKLGLSLRFSRHLLAYPTVTWVDALLARTILNALVDVLVAVLVFGGILLIFDVRVIVDAGAIALAATMGLALAFGVGTMNCFLFMRFPAWQLVFGIAMRPMFFVSGIFFLLESVPMPFRDWLWWNPIAHLVGMMRRGFYASYEAPWVSPLYVFGLSAALCAMAMLLLRRNYQDLLTR